MPFHSLGFPRQRKEWFLVEVHLIGPLSANTKNIFLIKMVDVFSNWISYIPVQGRLPYNIASAMVSEFKSFGFPSCLRFVTTDTNFFEEIKDMLEKEVQYISNNINQISNTFLFNSGGRQTFGHQLNVYINKTIEDCTFNFRDLESFYKFITMDGAHCDHELTHSFYIFHGEHSIIDKPVQKWHSDALTNFINLNPSKWLQKLPFFIFCLRNWIPPGFKMSPMTNVFHHQTETFNSSFCEVPYSDDDSSLDSICSSDIKDYPNEELEKSIGEDSLFNQVKTKNLSTTQNGVPEEYIIKPLYISITRLPNFLVERAKSGTLKVDGILKCESEQNEQRCPRCHKEFADKNDLFKHFRHIHLGV